MVEQFSAKAVLLEWANEATALALNRGNSSALEEWVADIRNLAAIANTNAVFSPGQRQYVQRWLAHIDGRSEYAGSHDERFLMVAAFVNTCRG